MSISNGQPVNAAVTNAAFVSRTTDSTVVSKLSLDRSLSGDTIEDAQQSINDLINAGDTLQTQIDDVVTDLSTHESLTAAHGATGEVVGTTNTQTLTNKTLTSPVINTSDIDGGTASNTSRITLPKDTKSNLDLLTRKEGSLVFDTTSGKPYYDNGTDLQLVGSGSGGAENWINDSDATNAPNNIFSLAKYTAGARPPATLTSSGSPSITRSIVTVSPEKLFSLSHPASNTQGEAFEITDITLPYTAVLTPQMVKIKIPYIVDLGTFQAGSPTQDSDLIVYIGYYDSGSSSWKTIEPSNINFLSNVSDVYESSFQTIKNVTQYKILLYCATTTTQSFTILINKPVLAPSQYVYAPVVTDWQSFTPTGSWTTNTNYTGRYRRVGDMLQVKARATATGAPTSATLTFNLPAGLIIDTTKLNGTNAEQALGIAQINDTGINQYPALVAYNSTSGVSVRYYAGSGTITNGVFVTQSAPLTFGSGDFVDVEYSVPIQGWTSNTQQSDGYDARDISFKSTFSGLTGINPNNTTIKLLIPSSQKDTVAGWEPANNGYRIKTAGAYNFDAAVSFNSTNVQAAYHQLFIFKNGVEIGRGGQYATLSTNYFGLQATAMNIDCVAGDIIDLRFYGSANYSVSTLSQNGSGHFSGSKIQAPTTMSKGATVAASFSTSTARTINNTSPIIIYETVDFDFTGSYNAATGEFKAPVAGLYDISGYFQVVNTTTTINAANLLIAYVNGTISKRIAGVRANATSAVSHEAGGATKVKLNAGDVVTFRFYADTANTLTSITPSANWITIQKVD